MWQWENLRHKRGRQKGKVHIRERYPHGEGVLTYLARYIRGGHCRTHGWWRVRKGR